MSGSRAPSRARFGPLSTSTAVMRRSVPTTTAQPRTIPHDPGESRDGARDEGRRMMLADTSPTQGRDADDGHGHQHGHDTDRDGHLPDRDQPAAARRGGLGTAR